MTPRQDDPRQDRNKRNRHVTVYDAVAGRAGYEGFLAIEPPAKDRDTASTTTKAVPPQEVLFQRKGAPTRYAEDDVYFQDRHLRPDQKLPDSDLLKALHAYASDFYGCALPEVSESDFRSLDETALLAFGILIEESARAAVGTGGGAAVAESASFSTSADDTSESGG